MSGGAVWWIVGGVIAVAIAGLVASVLALLEHVRPLRRAARRLRIRAEQAETLQAKVVKTQERAAILQIGANEAAARVEQVKASWQSDAT